MDSVKHLLAPHQANDAMKQLRHKKEARVCGNRVEKLQTEYQGMNKKLREEADQYLSMIEQALKGIQQIYHIFGIRWSITA